MAREDEVLVVDGDDEEESKPTEAQAIIRLKKGYRSKTARIELTGPWRGFWFDANVNPKRKVWKLLTTEGTTDRAIAQVVVAHNLIDDDGKSLPSPLTEASLEDLPYGLIVQIVKSYAEAVNEAAGVPKST